MSSLKLDLEKVYEVQKTSIMSTVAGIEFCDTSLRCMVMVYRQLTDDGTLLQASDRCHGFSKTNILT